MGRDENSGCGREAVALHFADLRDSTGGDFVDDPGIMNKIAIDGDTLGVGKIPDTIECIAHPEHIPIASARSTCIEFAPDTLLCKAACCFVLQRIRGFYLRVFFVGSVCVRGQARCCGGWVGNEWATGRRWGRLIMQIGRIGPIRLIGRFC